MSNAIRVSRLISFAALALAISFVMGSVSPLKAESPWEKAVVTFDRPVEVPGKVLPPGSYMFKTVENNELVQIFSADERQLFATVLVVPEDRPAVSSDIDCFVQLNKTRGAGAPQEVQSFFLPGRTSGYLFIYPNTLQTRRTRG
jgi:hypothetical protein